MTTATVGAAKITRIEETYDFFFEAKKFFANWRDEIVAEHMGWMVPNHYNPATGFLKLSIHSWLLEIGGRKILIDTCVGNHKSRKHRPFWDDLNTPYLERLAAAGVKPEDIDMVMCTHLHVDHVGWNTRLDNGRWVPTFPNARYLISRREWDHWQAAGMAALARTGDYITDSVLLIFKAGQADLIGDEHLLASDIALEAAPGHTPGLTLVRLDGGRREAILCSDLMHHPLQVQYPTWSTRFCADPDQARQTRIEFFKKHADSGRLVFPTHFPTPTGGTIMRDGAEYLFVFDGESCSAMRK
jgi:glyoxylase-like metal-dependent hydrolase (beta-lactamase superfamily II)